MPINPNRRKDRGPIKLETLEQVGDALKRLCEIEAHKKSVEAEVEQALISIKANAETRLKPLMAECDDLTRALVAYARAHKAEYVKGKKRSLVLTHGKIGMRKEAGKLRISAATTEQREDLEALAIEALEADHPEAVKVTKRVLVGPLRTLGPDIYEPLGFKYVGAGDVPYCEPNKAKVEDIFKAIRPKPEAA